MAIASLIKFPQTEYSYKKRLFIQLKFKMQVDSLVERIVKVNSNASFRRQSDGFYVFAGFRDVWFEFFGGLEVQGSLRTLKHLLLLVFLLLLLLLMML